MTKDIIIHLSDAVSGDVCKLKSPARRTTWNGLLEYSMPYFEPGRVRWDPSKDDKTIRKGEQDARKPLSELEPIFMGSETDGFIVEDDRKDYGERRFWLFREFEGRFHKITFNMRGHDGATPHIISGHYIGKKKFEQMRDGPAVKHNLARGVCTISFSLPASAIVTSE